MTPLKIYYGQACVKGTRMPVHQIARMLANGDTVGYLLAEYPFLSREDIMASLEKGRPCFSTEIVTIDN